MPKPKHGSAEYYKQQLKKEQNKNRFAWAQIFNLQHQYHELLLEHYENVENRPVPENGEPTEQDNFKLTQHYYNVIQDLYEKAKAQVECSICLEVIQSKDLDMTSCGHSYHKSCLEQLFEASAEERFVPCPECRGNLWNKKYSN